MPHPESPEGAKIDELQERELTSDETESVKGGANDTYTPSPLPIRKIDNPRLIVPCV